MFREIILPIFGSTRLCVTVCGKCTHGVAGLRPATSWVHYTTCPETAVLWCGLEKNGMVGAWHGHGMASVNQRRPHFVNQMGKTRSQPLAARYGRGTAWERHAMCESALGVPAKETSSYKGAR